MTTETTPRWRYVAGIASTAGAVWRASAGLHWADYDAAGQRVATGADWSTTPTPAELAAWDEAAPTIAARAARWALPLDALYIRWRALPRSGRSRNHATGALEAGVSVYRACYDPVTDGIVYDDTALAGAAITYLLTGADCWLVTGEELGLGSDGEPVLRAPRILARLVPTADGFTMMGV